MIHLFLFFVSVLNLSFAETQSHLVSKVVEAIQLRKENPELKSSQVVAQDLVLILNLIEKHGISNRTLGKWSILNPSYYRLKNLPEPAILKSQSGYPPLALHAHKFLVAEESDDVMNDDIYVSFFITDGYVPTGRVSSIYRSLDEGESFFFTPNDRILYPIPGVNLMIPRGHLIIDYMIIESDGDDISELKRISGFITELAIEYYQRRYGDTVLGHLREEVRALSEALLDLNHDDRLVSATWAPSPEEVISLFGNSTYAEFTRTHKESSPWGDFKYKMTFRLIR